jgi:hypothetical protein
MNAHPLFSHFVRAALRRRDEIARSAAREENQVSSESSTVN